MALMDILAAAQDGRLFAVVGHAVALPEADTRAGMDGLCRAIAQSLHTKMATDPAMLDGLLDMIDEGGAGESIDDAQSLTDADAIADGNAILEEIYGSRDAAIKAMRQAAPEVPEVALGRLSAISATAVLGVLAKRQAPLGLAQAQSAAGGGLFGTIIGAIVKGALQGVVRQLKPRRRRRYSSYFGRRRSAGQSKRRPASRRTATPSLDEIFGDILGKIRV